MKNKKDTKALLIGLGLIVLVMLTTFFRSSFFSGKNNQAVQQDDKQTKDAKQKYQTISTERLKKKLALGEKINLLDIRSFDDFAAEHIVDSINIAAEDLPVGSKIDAKNPVVIITEDMTDENILTVIDSLQSEHVNNIQVLAGGMTEWKKMAGSTVNFGNPNSFADQSKVSYVQPEDLNDALKSNVSTFILDVRTQQEYAGGHIKGAINIPFDDLEKRRNELSSIPRIVVAGINELQEFEASVQLYDMILIQPFVLKQGMPGWQKKNFELVK